MGRRAHIQYIYEAHSLLEERSEWVKPISKIEEHICFCIANVGMKHGSLVLEAPGRGG